MSDSNPLTIVHRGLWTLLENSSEFCRIVDAGNRYKLLDGTGNPLRKGGAQKADFPATMIEPVDGLGVADFTNTDGHIKKTFRVKVATANRQLEEMYELEWVIFCAMYDWRSLEALTWKGAANFIKHFAIYDNQTTERDRELNKLETGWATVLTGEAWLLAPHVNIVPGPG